MTLEQLKTALIWEGKLKGNTETIAQLDSIILDAAYLIGQSHPELLLSSSIEYDLFSENPTPYVAAFGIDRVELSGVAQLDEPVTIPEETQVVGPAPIAGWPKCYAVEGNADIAASSPKGLRVRLYPGGSLDVGSDKFTVWYKTIPLLTADSDTIPASWIVFLKKECLSRISLQRAKGESDDAKGYLAGAQLALQVESGTDAKSTSATN